MKCRLLLGKKNAEKTALDRTVREWYFHGRQRCLGQRTTETLCGGLCRSRGDYQKQKKKNQSRSTKNDGDRHSTEEGRVAEITIDLVLQARAKMAESKVNVPEDSIVSEMIKQLPTSKILRDHAVLPRAPYGAGRRPRFLEDCV